MVGFAQADDNARLDFNLTAIDTADFTDTNRVASSSHHQHQTHRHQPLIHQRRPTHPRKQLRLCHQTGEAGAPFWELTDASDATRIADGLALITKSRYMPPFLATDAGIPSNTTPASPTNKSPPSKTGPTPAPHSTPPQPPPSRHRTTQCCTPAPI
jgi:hypothetical protein